MPNIPPPVVSLAVPVLGWYTVDFGGIQMSQMLGLPSDSYLSSPDGVNTGLVGIADGAMLHLNGYAITGDNGSLWVMWSESSLATPDGVTVWNPFPSPAAPGRWLAQLPVAPPVSRVITTGAIIALSPSTEFVAVRKMIPSLTTLQLPPLNQAILGQRIAIKVDQNAPRYPTTVATIDGATFDNQVGVTSFVIAGLYEEIGFTPDGITWNIG